MDKRYSVTVHCDSVYHVETIIRLTDFILDDDEHVNLTITPELLDSFNSVLAPLVSHIREGHWDLDSSDDSCIAGIIVKNCSRLINAISDRMSEVGGN
jgi:hypothetical protein